MSGHKKHWQIANMLGHMYHKQVIAKNRAVDTTNNKTPLVKRISRMHLRAHESEILHKQAKDQARAGFEFDQLAPFTKHYACTER